MPSAWPTAFHPPSPRWSTSAAGGSATCLPRSHDGGMTLERQPALPDCRPMKSRRTPSLALGTLAPVLIALAACGAGDGDAGSSGTSGASGGNGGPNLALAAEGKDIAARNGCAACHGANGEGGVGPPWVGLLGCEVELNDGSR